MNKKLWTRDYTLFMLATLLGSVGAVASGFALSFLVFDETGSTLASAIILAIQLVPVFIVPLVAAPWMDRLPRKAFLVGGDFCDGVIFVGMGAYLLFFDFSYIGYLCISLLISCLQAVGKTMSCLQTVGKTMSCQNKSGINWVRG